MLEKTSQTHLIFVHMWGPDFKHVMTTQAWWYMSIIPPLRDSDTGGSKVLRQPGLHSKSLKTKQHDSKNKLNKNKSKGKKSRRRNKLRIKVVQTGESGPPWKESHLPWERSDSQ